MTWFSPITAAKTKRWPIGRDKIRVACEKYRLAIQAGRKPPSDGIKCLRDGRGYRIQDVDLDAWLKRQTT